MKEQVTFRLGEKLIEEIKIKSIKDGTSYSETVQVLLIQGLFLNDLYGKDLKLSDPETLKDFIDKIYHSDLYVL